MNCECGCGEAIPAKHLFRYKPPFVLRGHRLPTPICKCGCGEYIEWSPNLRYQQRQGFRKGHHNRKNTAPQPCKCGCGAMATVFHSIARAYISGHNSYGMKRGPGRYVNNFGYVMLRMPEHPDAGAHKGYVREHRYVMEKKLGRRLRRDEHVHHVNGDKEDNSPENLEVYDRAAHGRLHGRGHSAKHR